MKRILRSLPLGVLILTIFLMGCDSKPKRALYERAGGFSYDPPKGWKITEFPGAKYRVSLGTSESDFTANINVVDEKYSGTQDEYVATSIKNIGKLLADSSVIKQDNFQTDDNLSGVRVVFTDSQFGKSLRQTAYFFSNSNRRYVVTCTALKDGGERMDDVFAASMKTFRLH